MNGPREVEGRKHEKAKGNRTTLPYIYFAFRHCGLVQQQSHASTSVHVPSSFLLPDGLALMDLNLVTPSYSQVQYQGRFLQNGTRLLRCDAVHVARYASWLSVKAVAIDRIAPHRAILSLRLAAFT